MSQAETIHDMFDSIAVRYDAANHILSFGLDRYWRKKVVKLANPKEGADVLDICCGTGDLTFAFGKFSKAASITGCDFSDQMLEIAKRKAKKQTNCHFERSEKSINKRKDFSVSSRFNRDDGRNDKTNHFQWVNADCTTADFAGKKFDIISCAFGVRNLADRSAALRNILNLLKPDGKFCILEFSLPKNSALKLAARGYLRIVPFWGAVITANKAAYGYLSKTICRWAETIDFPAELHAAGFTDIKVYELSFGMVRIYLAS
ncbi:MAG: class I SAM-dependent methyltransferase [Phycisphaerae bacterium]|nr:class I SAM-dependent methyltransferase [Phycisphaerae bacterium]